MIDHKAMLKKINAYQKKHKVSPSVAEVAEMCTISRQAAHTHIKLLIASGKIVEQPHWLINEI